MTAPRPSKAPDRSVYRGGRLAEYDGHEVLSRKKVGYHVLACKTCTVPFRTGRDTVRLNYRARCPACDPAPPTKMQLLLRYLRKVGQPLPLVEIVVGVWLDNRDAFRIRGYDYPDSHAVNIMLSHGVRRGLILRTKRGHYTIAPEAPCSPETAEPTTQSSTRPAPTARTP